MSGHVLVAIVMVFAYSLIVFWPERIKITCFWIIFLLNAFLACIFYAHSLATVILLLFCFNFICYLFRKQLKQNQKVFNQISKEMFLTKERKSVRVLNSFKFLISELLKLNHFWRNILGLSYVFTSAIITLLAMLIYFSNDIIITTSFVFVIVMFYFLGFVAPIWTFGEVQVEVSIILSYDTRKWPQNLNNFFFWLDEQN